MALTGHKLPFLIEMLIAHIKTTIWVYSRNECAHDDTAALIGGPNDVAILPVVEQRIAAYLTIGCIGDGAEAAVVVVERSHVVRWSSS